MRKLTLYHQGDKVTINKVGGSGAFKKRLLDMGFMKGAKIEIVKYAPLRDPMELVIKEFHVSLRVSEADKILVEAA